MLMLTSKASSRGKRLRSLGRVVQGIIRGNVGKGRGSEHHKAISNSPKIGLVPMLSYLYEVLGLLCGQPHFTQRKP